MFNRLQHCGECGVAMKVCRTLKVEPWQHETTIDSVVTFSRVTPMSWILSFLQRIR